MNAVQYVVAFICFSRTTSRTSIHNQSVFLVGDIKSFCDMKCGAETHTMCPNVRFICVFFLSENIHRLILSSDHHLQFNPPSKCSTYMHLHATGTFQDLVLNGHNGLRNRVALKYNVSNMRKMVRNFHIYIYRLISHVNTKFSNSILYIPRIISRLIKN